VRAAVLAFAALAGSSVATAEGVAIAPKIGSTGAGADLTIGIARTLNLRLGAQGWSRSETRTEQEIEYDAELSLLSGDLCWIFIRAGEGFESPPERSSTATR
jgi:hypothetical protein